MRCVFATVAAVHMEPFVAGPLATQPLWQAGAPTTIKIHYDVPVHGASDEVNSNRGGFLQKRGDRDSFTDGIQGAEALVEDSQSVSSEISQAKTRINSGGVSDQKKGLATLFNLLSTAPNARALALAMGVTNPVKQLMLKEHTPRGVRGLAGSVLTLMTNMPVATETTTTDDASYGNVHIVMPRPSRVYHADQALLR